MSANIFWTPIKERRHDISVGAPTSFIASIENAFGGLPLELNNTEVNIATLKGMISASGSSDAISSYEKLISALGKYDRIKIWAEW
jgi:hypothetical protein